MLINGKEIKTTNDALAKYIFTTDGSGELSKDFVNAVLGDLNFRTVDDFILTSPVFSATNYNAKSNYFDVKGETSKHDHINIEIQRLNHEGFPIRLINNLLKQINLVRKGVKYSDFPNFYVIGLCNFILDILPYYNGFHDCHYFTSIFVPNRYLSTKPQIHILEIPKWEIKHTKSITKKDLKKYSKLDYWMKFFSDKTTYEEIEIMASEALVIEKAKNKIDQFVGNPNNLNAYDDAEEAERIRLGEIDFAVNVAKDEARNESKIEIAQNLLKAKIDPEVIKTATGLSSERINEIRATLQ